MSAAEDLRDAFVRHQVDLGRFSNQLVQKTIALLNRAELDIVARLQRADNEGLNRDRLETLLADIRTIERQMWAILGVQFDADLVEVTEAELEFAKEAVDFAVQRVGVALGSPTPAFVQVMAAVRARPFQGRILSEWLSGADEMSSRRVREAIRMGFVQGETIGQIVRRIRGTRAAAYRNGIMEINRRSAETMVRTAITHTSAVAQQMTYEANADIVSGVRWVSVLDSRTTVICAGLDGRVFPLDKGPRPPQHPNCRSTIIPEIQGMDMSKIMERPTFDAWLRGQPESVQKDILGAARLKLWRDGELALDRFTDSKNRMLTLPELRQKNRSAFALAGVDRL